MIPQVNEIRNLDELRDYVNQTLCSYDHFVLDAFPLTEHILLRGGKPCGIYFCLHGPRRVKFTAIWETESHTVLFYNSAGERFHKTQLMAAPELELAAA